MERVLGIGGLFFGARDPVVLARWFEAHLGVVAASANYGESPWWQEAGPTVLAPFPEESTYCGDPEQASMVNCRVRNLDAMIAQLRRAGIEVVVDSQEDSNGRFARLHDPEGNPIELWETMGPDR